MRSNVLVLVVVCSLLTAGITTIGATTVSALESPPIQNESVTETEIENHSAIIKVYPNLPIPQNRDEYVVVTLAEPGNWTLTDGVSTVSLPSDRTGPIAVTRDSHLTRNITAYPVYETITGFRLSQDGETLTLKRDGKMVDEISYDRATEGDRWHRNASQQWIPDGLTLRETVDTGPATVETFVLPDTPYQSIEPIATATDRVHPVAVRVDEPNGRYGKIHAKGLVVDNTTIVGLVAIGTIAYAHRSIIFAE